MPLWHQVSSALKFLWFKFQPSQNITSWWNLQRKPALSIRNRAGNLCYEQQFRKKRRNSPSAWPLVNRWRNGMCLLLIMEDWANFICTKFPNLAWSGVNQLLYNVYLANAQYFLFPPINTPCTWAWNQWKQFFLGQLGFFSRVCFCDLAPIFRNILKTFQSNLLKIGCQKSM